MNVKHDGKKGLIFLIITKKSSENDNLRFPVNILKALPNYPYKIHMFSIYEKDIIQSILVYPYQSKIDFTECGTIIKNEESYRPFISSDELASSLSINMPSFFGIRDMGVNSISEKLMLDLWNKSVNSPYNGCRDPRNKTHVWTKSPKSRIIGICKTLEEIKEI